MIKSLLIALALLALPLTAETNDDVLRQEFKKLMPVHVTVPSNPGQWALFHADGTIRDKAPYSQEAYGTWKIKDGKLQIDVLIIYHNEGGAPCKPKKGKALSKEACFKKMKTTVSHPMEFKDGKLSIDGAFLETDEKGNRGFILSV